MLFHSPIFYTTQLLYKFTNKQKYGTIKSHLLNIFSVSFVENMLVMKEVAYRWN